MSQHEGPLETNWILTRSFVPSPPEQQLIKRYPEAYQLSSDFPWTSVPWKKVPSNFTGEHNSTIPGEQQGNNSFSKDDTMHFTFKPFMIMPRQFLFSCAPKTFQCVTMAARNMPTLMRLVWITRTGIPGLCFGGLGGMDEYTCWSPLVAVWFGGKPPKLGSYFYSQVESAIFSSFF